MRLALPRPLILAALCACSSPRRFGEADRAEIEGLLRRQQEAWNRGDLPAFMEGYARSPELVFTSRGQIRRGFDETLASYRKRYGGDRAGMGQLGFEILVVQPVGADGAVVLGRWRLEGTPQAGGGIFSVVVERRPEGWRIIHDHTTSSPE